MGAKADSQTSFTPSNVTEEDIQAVEDIAGMGCGAWDTIDPREIIAASVHVMSGKEVATVPFDSMSRRTIDHWFESWKSAAASLGARPGTIAEAIQESRLQTIDRIHRLAIAGLKKARRNKAALRAAVSSELRKLADAWNDSMEGE